MGLFDMFKKQKATAAPSAPLVEPTTAKTLTAPKSETHHVAGVKSYIDNIMELVNENPDYDMSKKEIIESCMDGEKIYQYFLNVKKVELVPEPTNEHDANAVKVILDGVHVGYIKKGSCSHIKKLLANNSIKSMSADIVCGKYKLVYEDDDAPGGYTLERDKTEYGIIIEILVKSE